MINDFDNGPAYMQIIAGTIKIIITITILSLLSLF
jgi:hypothetical protein